MGSGKSLKIDSKYGAFMENTEGLFSQLKETIEMLDKQIREMESVPDELEVSFGVKLSAQAGAVIALGSTDSTFTVKAKWNLVGKE